MTGLSRRYGQPYSGSTGAGPSGRFLLGTPKGHAGHGHETLIPFIMCAARPFPFREVALTWPRRNASKCRSVHRAESRAVESATVAWMLAVVTTLVCATVASIAWLVVGRREDSNQMLLLVHYLHFSSIVTGIVSLVLLGVVLKRAIRRRPLQSSCSPSRLPCCRSWRPFSDTTERAPTPAQAASPILPARDCVFAVSPLGRSTTCNGPCGLGGPECACPASAGLVAVPRPSLRRVGHSNEAFSSSHRERK